MPDDIPTSAESDPLSGHPSHEPADGAMGPTGPANDPHAWQPPTPEALQARLSGYEVLEFLARGGMGAVYRGVQTSLARQVAIKILPPQLRDADPQYAGRFKQEARSMAQLNHPGIVAVHDFGEMQDGTLYFVMEFIDGTDVGRMVANQGRLSSAHAMAITAHVCDALQYAHEHGVVHRDIKPANIMVGYDGRVKVADFGLAKSVHQQNLSLTVSGHVMGTPHFVAPEALTLGMSIDHRADIYAVGVMLYQMLTGKLPQGLFEMPSMQVPGLDPRYDGIIGKALREDREVRYQQILDMRHALDAIMTQPVVKVEATDGKPPAALTIRARPQRASGPPASLPRPAPPPKSSSSGLVAATVLVLAGAAAFFFLGMDRPAPTDSSALPQPGAENGMSPLAQPPKATPSSTDPAQATMDKPFVNSLGMKFVPVPGTHVLFCIHETRKADYAAFFAATPGVQAFWQNPSYEGAPVSFADDHPVCNIRWQDCQDFCRWLSRKEGRTYRLPTDREWSFAVGIGDREDESLSPHVLSDRLTGEFPWGKQWPPPAGAGNLGDSTMAAKFPKKRTIPGYTDGFATTAPVMSFSPNQFGLYDLSGNVWEFCEDWFDGTRTKYVIRGLNFDDSGESSVRFLSSHRGWCPVGNRHSNFGFRVVLERAAKPAADRGAAAVSTASTPAPSADSMTWTDMRDAFNAVREARTALPTGPTTWTDTKGRSLTATFKTIAGGNVLLDIAGKITPVALNTLSAESQKQAHDYQRAAASAAASSPARQLSPAMAAAQATREAPFVNTLGMKFVPVPGTRLLMCVHETRRRDYAEYALQVPGVHGQWKAMGYKGLPSGHEDTHPVIGVNWDDANAFCQWLSQKEFLNYRLPTDREWSIAAGLQEKPSAQTTPEMLDGVILDQFPWGGGKPPKDVIKAGNYVDTSYIEAFKTDPKRLEGIFVLGHTDGFPTTAPVMSFRPNGLGLYDMGGNVREWCADWYNTAKQWRVLRGSSWQGFRQEDLLTSGRAHIAPSSRLDDCGFRCVLDLTDSAGSPSPGAAADTPTESAEVKLEFSNAEKYFDIGGFRPVELPMSRTPPPSVRQVPPGLASPLYGELRLGAEGTQRRHPIILNHPKTAKAALLVDGNANGFFVGDAPARWQPGQQSNAVTGQKWDTFQGEFHVELTHADGVHPARFEASQNTSANSTSDSLWIHPQYARVGTVTLGGKPYDALLYDDGCTGDFSALTSTFRLDLDQRGGFRWEEAEAFPVTEYFTVDGVNYQLSGLTPGGESFRIIPSQGWTGKVAPAFSATSITGESVVMPSGYKGKLLLLHFWTTGQKSRPDELPHLQALYEKHHSAAFDMLGICVEYRSGREKLPAFVKENAIAWPQVCDHQAGVMEHPLLRLYRNHSVPNNFLIDADSGIAIACGLRGSELDSVVSKALGERGP